MDKRRYTGDYLEGCAGSDTYIFGCGGGHDIISNYDAGTDKKDVLKFVGGVRPDEIRLERSGNDLYLKIIGAGDQVRIDHFFRDGGQSAYVMDEIQFDDGTVWLPQDIMNYMEHNIPLPTADSAAVTPSIQLLKQSADQFMFASDGDDSGEAEGITQLTLPQKSANSWSSAVGY